MLGVGAADAQGNTLTRIMRRCVLNFTMPSITHDMRAVGSKASLLVPMAGTLITRGPYSLHCAVSYMWTSFILLSRHYTYLAGYGTQLGGHCSLRKLM